MDTLEMQRQEARQERIQRGELSFINWDRIAARSAAKVSGPQADASDLYTLKKVDEYAKKIARASMRYLYSVVPGKHPNIVGLSMAITMKADKMRGEVSRYELVEVAEDRALLMLREYAQRKGIAIVPWSEVLNGPKVRKPGPGMVEVKKPVALGPSIMGPGSMDAAAIAAIKNAVRSRGGVIIADQGGK